MVNITFAVSIEEYKKYIKKSIVKRQSILNDLRKRFLVMNDEKEI